MQIDIAAEVSTEIQKNLADQQAAEVQAEIKQQRQVDFQSSMTVAAGFEPNKFAQALQVERKSGIPAKVAYDNWDRIEEVKQQDKLSGLFNTAPRTAEALSTPSNAIVAKGDEDNLRSMEQAIEKADFYEQGFFERQIAGPLRQWWSSDTLSDTPGRIVELGRITADFDRVDAGEDFSSPWANEYRNADEAGRKAMRDNANLERNLALDKARVAQFDLNKLPADPTDRAFQEADGVAGALAVAAEDPAWLGRVAVKSLPDMAQSLVVGLINPLLGGVSEGVTSSNYKFMEVLQEKGVDASDPVQLMQALRNDDLLQEASQRSARYGAGIGLVSMASFGLLGRVMAPAAMGGQALSRSTREAISAGVQIPVQGALEATGELAGQIAERGRVSDVNSKEVALEGLVGALMAGPEAGAFATKRFTNHMIQARRTERAAGVQSDLVAKSLESSTRKNDPASFDTIVGAQLAGQPNEYIEIPAAKLNELNQSGMVNIPELLENVGIDPNHYTAQVELGGTIRMKNSSYLAYLSEQDQFLGSSIRVASNDYSLDEVQELDRQMVADMEKIASQFGQADEMAGAYSDVMGQLLASGYERGAADTTARQYAAVMTRLAQQTGQTVQDVMQANPLNIARDIPKQVRRIKGDDLSLMLGRLRAGDIPQSADMFGKSLTEYLTAAGGLADTGGELAAFDADVGKVGRNRLARAGGKSLDDAAMAAWERGYFTGMAREDVTPNMLIDALREEAAGTPRFSAEQENATLRDQAANLEALQAYLDEQGVDMETATDEEVLALLRGQDGQAGDQMLNQQDLTPDQQRLVSMSEDEYIAAVNPDNKRSDAGDIVIVREGDLFLPSGSELIEQVQDRAGQPVEVYADKDGSLYAVQNDEVVGQIENRDNETLNIVTVEAQGKGIGTTLAAALIRRDPFAQAGSFSPAGEAARRAAFRKVKAELLATQMLSQSQTSQRERKPETMLIDSMTGDGTTKVLKNPTRNQALAFAKGAKYESVRGIVDPETGDLYIADSNTVDHKMLAEGVGLDWEGVRYSTDPDTGSSNRLSIPAKAIEFYPRNIFSDDVRQTLNQSAVNVTPEQSAEYTAAVAGNKRRAAIKLLEQAAGVEEVDASFDREGAHDAPGPGAGSPIYDVTRDGTYPEDFYGPNGLKWYGAGDDTDAPAYSIIKGLEARPNAPVKVYRAVPKDGAKKIIGGDWVATVRQYAKDHGEAALGGDYKILSATVSARDLFTSGDSFAEYGYHPQPFKPEFPKSESAKSKSLADAAENFATSHPDSVGLTTLNQSQPGAAQTEAEAFKRWFGDSKVVDAQGKPLVVYHGSPDLRFLNDGGEFKSEKGRYGFGRVDAAHWFAAAERTAKSYADPRRAFDYQRAEEGVIPVYLKMENPLIVDGKGQKWRDAQKSGKTTDVIEEARQGGHDGVIIRNVRDNYQTGVTAGDQATDTYVVWESSQIKSADKNSGAFAPESPNIYQQAGEDDARGSITFGPRQDGVRRFDIRLGKRSDLSTVLHEMGHYYLEVIGDLVMDGKANELLVADYGVIRDWLGAEAGKPLSVDQHEQFARGFEKYLAEGKAPSIELQGAFARFKRWLTGIYKDLKRLNVELTPEVRGVFDRLLASEDAITEAEEALALSAQYESSITELMTPDERANYTRASQQARDEATTEIEQEILRAEQRKEMAWYRDQRKKVEAEVRDELEASQPYQARKYLFGNQPHPQLGRVLRLDTAAVTELFGTKSKEARFLGRARAKENGVHPDIAASLLGYINPVEMLTDMRSVPSLAEAIETEAERRMAERYPDPRVDGTLAEKAMMAVGEREAEVQAIQLRALAREAGRKASQHRVIKEAARQHISRLKLRDVIPYTFQRASTKAAKAVEAALLDGNMPKAYEEKEKQLMNLHLYREAVLAQELAQKKRDQAKAYMKPGAKRKRLQDASVENYELAYPDGRIEYAATKAAAKLAEAEGATVTPLFNFLEQVDQLLTKYEFGIPRRAIRQQREALATFLASMAGENIVVNPAEWVLLDRAERTNWKELTIGELEDVVDMIRQIDQMAKNKLMVLKGDKWAEFEPLRDAIVATVEQNASKARNSQFNKSFADDIRRWGREWLGLLPADQIARELDGQDELGPVQENITTPVQVAGREVVIREKAEHQGLADLIKQFYTDDQIRGMNDPSKLIAIQEIGDSMTRMQMVMLMANLGNEGNRQALLKEERSIWTAETIQAVMGRLSQNDADFVEALWSWVDKFWPEVAENEGRRTGVVPAKVQGDPYPVRLADGKVRVLRGGYFPLKYDGDLSIKTSQDEVANAFKNMTAGRTAKAYTPEGHKIERVGSGGRPVKLDFSVVTGHLNEVIRDIVMTDPVNQAWRFLHDKEVQGSFERSNLKELFTALEIWLQDTAEGEKVDSGYMTASARWLRTGFTANVMLFNLANSMLNLAGTHPLVVLGKRWAVQGYRDAFMPANWNQMYELSSFMREARIESYNKDLALVQDQMQGKGGWRAAMTTAGFYLHNKTQMFMDAVTWMGAYQKGMSQDLVGQDLVTYADQRVVEASGSGVFADRSAMERGTLSRQTRQNELVRGLTMLAGYMIRKMAIARRRTAETRFKDIGQAMNWAVDMALLFTIEGLMFAAVKGNIPDDEDEDQAAGWAKSAAWETIAGLGSGLPPFGRPIVAGIQGFGGGSSGIDIFAEQFGNAVTQAKQGDADVTAAKAVVAMVGTATKTPGIATNRVIDWLDRSQDGETPPWWELFTGNRSK